MSFEIPADLRQKYLERRAQDLVTLRHALEISSFEDFKRIGHQLRGNAASYGYMELEAIAIQLELAADNSDRELASAQLDRMKVWLDSLER